MGPIESADAFRRAYPFHFEHTVEFREIDMLRHVNNVRYADWAETARATYLEDLAAIDFSEEQSVIIARHDMHFLAPVAYRDRIAIGGAIDRWGTKSFDFVTVVWSYGSSRLCFRSTATLVAFDYRANVSIVIPAAWRERVAARSHGTR